MWSTDAEKRDVAEATHFENFITMNAETAWLLLSVSCSLRHIGFAAHGLLDREATTVAVFYFAIEHIPH
jgi:hypothetical protein